MKPAAGGSVQPPPHCLVQSVTPVPVRWPESESRAFIPFVEVLRPCPWAFSCLTCGRLLGRAVPGCECRPLDALWVPGAVGAGQRRGQGSCGLPSCQGARQGSSRSKSQLGAPTLKPGAPRPCPGARCLPAWSMRCFSSRPLRAARRRARPPP